MVQLDNKERVIKIKTVYYGPALGGKTTSLQFIHGAIDPERRTRLYSLNTKDDRTLFFDLLSLDLGRIRGYRLTMQLCTVPGQVQYDATRKAVLAGADAVVFVADSQDGLLDENIESLRNLEKNMTLNGLDRKTVPVVLQYNKQDLSPLTPVKVLERTLNCNGAPSFLTVATSGHGVLDAFAEISARAAGAVGKTAGGGPGRQVAEKAQLKIREMIRALQASAPGESKTDETETVITLAPQPVGEPLGRDTLVHEAVRANLAMTDLQAELSMTKRQLERKVRVLTAITSFGQAVTVAGEPRQIVESLLMTAMQELRATGGAVLMRPATKQLSEVLTQGIAGDPLLGSSRDPSRSLAAQIMEHRVAVQIGGELDEPDSPDLVEAVQLAGFSSAIAAPLLADDRAFGLLTLYRGAEPGVFETDDCRLAAVMASTAALAFQSAGSRRRIEAINQSLESRVAERTQQLSESLAEVRRMAEALEERNRLLREAHLDLEDRNTLLERAHHDLEELDRAKSELLTRISHELRTPVTAISSAANILARIKENDPEGSTRFISIIREEANQLAELIQSVIHAALLAAADQHLEKVSTSVDDLLHRAIEPLKELAQARQVRIKIRDQLEEEEVACEPKMMEAALREIVKNSIQFSEAGNEVLVAAERRQAGGGAGQTKHGGATEDASSGLLISVCDSGAGIPQDDLARIYDMFWQGGDLMTSKPDGLGLGLAIAKRVVEGHGGKIETVSKIGQGTQVSILIPES